MFPYQAACSRRHTQTDTFPCRGTVQDMWSGVRWSVLQEPHMSVLKQGAGSDVCVKGTSGTCHSVNMYLVHYSA